MGDVPARMPWLLRLPLMLLPPRCRGCGLLLDVLHAAHAPAGQGLPYLCGSCWAGIPWLEEVSRPPPGGLSALWSACRYAPPVSDWIQAFKYGQQEHFARMLGALLRQAGTSSAAEGNASQERSHWATRFDWVVPVPLHPSRLQMRGFNQSLMLAHLWLRGLKRKGRPRLAGGMLRRTRATLPQVGLSGAERANNVDDAFGLGREGRLAGGASLDGRRVLLVDDVLTTGATLRACAEVLHAAGAGEVSALVLASAGEGES